MTEPSVAPPKTVPFRISATREGSSIEVDGVDVAPQTGAFTLTVQAGRPPVLTIFGAAEGEIDVEGVVEVKVDRDEREAIAAFLDSIDPAELERLSIPVGRALGLRGSFAPAYVAILRCWALGEPLPT